MTIDKNLEQVWSTQSSTTEGIDFASQHNKDFRVKGDFEIIYNDSVFKTLALAGTKQAIEITLEGRVNIGATKPESIVIQIASVILEDWDRSSDKDSMTMQSFGFTAFYKLAESKMITIDLTNAKATQYA